MDDQNRKAADRLAGKLEEKARKLREEGLTEADLDALAGGGFFSECCGSSCRNMSFICDTMTNGRCRYACIDASPD